MPLAPKPKKSKGEKKKKKKLLAFWTNPEDLFPFWGLKAGDLVKTPVGLIGTVLGVKYKTKQQDLEAGGKLWVEYPGKPTNYKSPLDFDLGELGGYTRCHQGDHIWQKLVPHEKKVEKIEDEREIIKELNRRYRAELKKKIDEESKKKKRKKKTAKTAGAAPANKPVLATTPGKTAPTPARISGVKSGR